MPKCPECPNQPEIPEQSDGNNELTIPKFVKPDKPRNGWVVYTGGPPETHLAMMQHTLPEDYTYGYFLPDGTIQYDKRLDDWEPPSLVEGYERDGQDSWSFHPLWKSCQFRMYSTEVKDKCRCIQVLAICSHPNAKLDEHGRVTYKECSECTKCLPIPIPLVPIRAQAGDQS